MCQAGDSRCKGLTSARELRRPEKQSRHTKREGGSKAGGETRTGGEAGLSPRCCREHQVKEKRGSMGAELVSGTGRKLRSHQRDLAWGWGQLQPTPACDAFTPEMCCCSVA